MPAEWAFKKKTLPENTKTAPSHCLSTRVFPKKMTDPSTVKNFLVVVMIEQGSGPNSLMHMKMKNWKQNKSLNDWWTYAINSSVLLRQLNMNKQFML